MSKIEKALLDRYEGLLRSRERQEQRVQTARSEENKMRVELAEAKATFAQILGLLSGRSRNEDRLEGILLATQACLGGSEGLPAFRLADAVEDVRELRRRLLSNGLNVPETLSVTPEPPDPEEQ